MKNFIAFFEIPTTDFKRAVDFYEFILNVKLLVSECEKEKMACFMDEDKTIGAIFYAPGFHPTKNGVLIHFYCDNIEYTLDKVVSKGGTVIMPITKIIAEGKGHFAIFSDSEGNHIGLYTKK